MTHIKETSQISVVLKEIAVNCFQHTLFSGVLKPVDKQEPKLVIWCSEKPKMRTHSQLKDGPTDGHSLTVALELHLFFKSLTRSIRFSL